jgi:acetyl esterase/lipase
MATACGDDGSAVAGDVIDRDPVADGLVRIRYRSTDLHGRESEATGLIAVPGGNPPPGGWPVVVYAHGATGGVEECAPSRDPSLGGVGPQLRSLTDAGFVAVAPDDAGAGMTGRHAFLHGRSAARSVVNAVRAAGEVEPATSRRWAVVGHSHGGHAALFAAGLAQELLPTHELVGAVAVAPVGDPAVLVGPLQTTRSPLMVHLVAGFLAARPSVEPESILSAAGLRWLEEATELCALGPAGGPILRRHVPELGRYLARNRAGQDGAVAPVLVQQGRDDRIVTFEHTLQTIDRLCRRGATVDVEVYDGVGHRDVRNVGGDPVLRWLHDRLAEHPAADDCHSTIAAEPPS